jgi:hypothetical protein
MATEEIFLPKVQKRDRQLYSRIQTAAKLRFSITPDYRLHHNLACMSRYESGHHQNLISTTAASHERLLQPSVTDIGY